MEPACEPPNKPRRSDWALYGGYAVEGGLGVLAAGIAWATGIPLASEIRFSPADLGWGLAATFPMLAALFILMRVSWPQIERIRGIVRAFARQLLTGVSWPEIGLLCALAGVGEELLFRGVVQTLLAERTSVVFGIVASGVLFGAVHFLTITYFVLASVVGCYFGWLYAATESLTTPIVAHALYDFVALAVVMRKEQSSAGGLDERPSR